MAALPQPVAAAATEAPLWRAPQAWLHRQRLSRAFWIYFVAAFCFDAGFAVYFFLFNLYLLDLHFYEKTIGLIGGAITLGSVAGTLPAGVAARRFGLRPLLVIAFLAAPAAGALRALWIGEPAQIALAFLAGAAMSGWTVSYLPAVAGLTTRENRPSAFSLVYAASIACSCLGAIVCGDLPLRLHRAGIDWQPAAIKRDILLGSCAIAAAGLAAVLRLPPQPLMAVAAHEADVPGLRLAKIRLSPALLRVLPVLMLWSMVLAAFTPFANVYLAHNLHLSLEKVGLLFAVSQGLQLCAILVNPPLFGAVGMVNGIAATELATALAMGAMALTPNLRLSVGLYLAFSVLQWMSSPGLYNLLMDRTPESERSTAAAITMFLTSLVSSAATAGAGFLFARAGYPRVLLGIAVLAAVAAALCRILLGSERRSRP
ncbi:MAG: MFS transporter [Acidobacteriaceae bacterium]